MQVKRLFENRLSWQLYEISYKNYILGTTIRDAHKREWVVGEPVGKGGFGMIYLCDQKDRVWI